jgi:hypothetical protein
MAGERDFEVTRKNIMKKMRDHLCTLKTIARTVMFLLLGLVGSAAISSVNSQAAGYTYTKVAVLGETAPGGSQYINDFEPGQINNRGDVIYVADLSTAGTADGFASEGVFLLSNGQIFGLALPTPGSVTGSLTPTGINNAGNAAFSYGPPEDPLGKNFGLYRYSAASKTVSSVVVPGVSSVPIAGTLQGVFFETSINSRDEICFTGLINTNVPLQDGEAIGKGIFVADKAGKIRKVVIPGDLAPFGKIFDFAELAWINDRGDVGFGAHVQGEEFIVSDPPNPPLPGDPDSVYLSEAPSGQIISIAHQGDPAPGGGVFRRAFGPILNNSGQILFVGDLTAPPGVAQSQGLYLFKRSATVPVVRPGDVLPDGTLVTVSDLVNGHHLNSAGEISFLAQLNTGDEAIYVKSGNTFRLVAKNGMSIPSVGTISNFDFGFPLNGGAVNNDRGQVVFSAILVEGGAALIVATPR